ncbi:MAG: hypothetical protein AUI10_10400 [Actinobacteria bacterium 13_2_20CM_2_72_6]|nr:MAG: hypothetical protein AUI10_10400 [Actinobacteria bacterium 13_2_20CM_2_72_6]
MVVGVAVAGLFPVGAPVAHAGPAPAPTASGTLGVDNPSGKADARGRPLNRNAHHAAAAPRVGATADTPAPECPATVHCVFVPAAYQQDDPADPSNYGNYDVADRPADGLAINTIVIHDTEGSLQSTINAFQDPLFYVSAHYVIDTDGTIYQMVRTKDVAWHAGNWWVNTHAIGIEHVGFAAAGNYPPAQYDASAKLVRWLAHRYGVPLDRQHVIGHDNVPAPDAAHVASMHWDPGPFWNWQHYMARLGVPVLPTGPGTRMVTVAPVWPLSQQPVTDCSSGTCVPLPAQPTNFVYLRQAPDATAPFLVDPVLGAGTTAADSVAAKAYLGQNLAVADHRFTADGVWLQVWYGGQQGWLFSPWRAPTVSLQRGRRSGVDGLLPRGDRRLVRALRPHRVQGHRRVRPHPVQRS